VQGVSALDLDGKEEGIVSSLPAMKLEIGEEHGVCVVAIQEEITCDNHRAFADAIDTILDDGSLDVVLDLVNVNFITSRGLGTIVGAYTVLKRRGGNLVLAGANEEVLRSLAITRLDKVLTLVPNRATAFKTLNRNTAARPAKPTPSADDTIA
jgi:anti-sigma B factor antagonist